jgi:ATP-dependent RNA helicase DHX57
LAVLGGAGGDNKDGADTDEVTSLQASILTPPDATAVNGAMEIRARLRKVAAASSRRALASTRPCCLRCGKLLVYGARVSCLKSCLTIAAVVTAGSPFVAGGGGASRRDEARRVRTAYARGEGNLLADLRAFEHRSQLV